MNLFVVISCVIFCISHAEVPFERIRRQSGLNGAHTDAMERSRDGGPGGSYNPLLTPGGFGARLGGGLGGKVYDSGSESVGVGAAVRGDVGLNGGSPFVRAPEVGVGATYTNGPNSFGVGAGRTFGSSPSNQYGFTFSRKFKRSIEDNDDEEVFYRQRRQANTPAMNTAMTNSMSNKPVGTPQFSLQVDGAGRNLNNFGASGNAGAGMKVWEGSRQSVGLGIGASDNLARIDGKTFTGSPQLGVGLGYQNGDFSASVGAGRETSGPARGNHYGLSLGYKFKRSPEDEEDAVYREVDEDNYRARRQVPPSPAMDTAVVNSLTNKPVGVPQLSYQVDAAGNNVRNFGASGAVGAGVKVWDSGPQSVGLGVGASGDLARVDGKTYTGNPQLGVGLGYQNGGFSAALGAGRQMAGPSRPYQVGLNLGYKFKRDAEDQI